MSRLLLLSVTALFIGALLLAAMQFDTGYVLVSFKNHTLEMSLWVLIAIVLLVTWLGYLIRSVLLRFLNIIFSGKSWWKASRENRKKRQTEKGLLHFIEGDWINAKRELISAAKSENKPVTQYLIAAKSAQNMGLTEESQFLLGQAEKNSGKTALPVQLARVTAFINTQEYESAYLLLKELESQAPKSPVIFDLLKDSCLHLKNWTALQELLPKLKKYKRLSDEAYKALEIDVHMGLLVEPVKALNWENVGALSEQETLEFYAKLKANWQKIPKSLKAQEQLAHCFALHAIRLSKHEQADSFIVQYLKVDWSEDLVSLYAEVHTSAKTRMHNASGWLKRQANSVALRLLIARLSEELELWGQAKQRYQEALTLQPTAKNYATFARFLEKTDDVALSNQMYKAGLIKALQG